MKPDDDICRRCAAIRLLVLDVDGVLTDGRLYYGADGEQLKTFHVHDGYGLRRLLDAGVRVAIISGRRSRAVEWRMRELGIDEVHLGCSDKAPLLARLADEAGIDSAAIAVVGDDAPDLTMMAQAGLAIAVADAQPVVQSAAHWTTTRPGGRGAVREVCDLIVEARTGGR